MSGAIKEPEQPVPAAQLQFEAGVDQAVHKMLVNYRNLLKKYSSLASQEGIGRHEPLQIDVACENIVRITHVWTCIAQYLIRDAILFVFVCLVAASWRAAAAPDPRTAYPHTDQDRGPLQAR
ncbi:hypothetical protein EON64_10160 [archaeon]|nr:MAG: hypothetical protein EON64_10160 [archaeon]